MSELSIKTIRADQDNPNRLAIFQEGFGWGGFEEAKKTALEMFPVDEEVNGFNLADSGGSGHLITILVTDLGLEALGKQESAYPYNAFAIITVDPSNNYYAMLYRGPGIPPIVLSLMEDMTGNE